MLAYMRMRTDMLAVRRSDDRLNEYIQLQAIIGENPSRPPRQYNRERQPDPKIISIDHLGNENIYPTSSSLYFS